VSGYLLDINVVIALIDPSHVHHARAHTWFAEEGRHEWLSSPTTQNGALRIVSHPRYSNTQPPALVARSVRSLLAAGGHRFIADRISLLDLAIVDPDALLSSSQLTDTYLLALAATERAQLATFDRRIVTAAVRAPGVHLKQVP